MPSTKCSRTSRFSCSATDVYRELVYTDGYHSFAEFQDMRDRIIVIQSFSKPYAMTGWRLGYCMADTPIRDRMQIFHQHAVVSAPSYVQPACVQALKTDVSGVRELSAGAGMRCTGGLRTWGWRCRSRRVPSICSSTLRSMAWHRRRSVPKCSRRGLLD